LTDVHDTYMFSLSIFIQV